MPITRQQALTQLLAHPKTFLRRYPIWIIGNATTASGVTGFEIDSADGLLFNGLLERPDSVWGTHKMRTTQTFSVALATAGVGGQAFQGHWLKMSEWTNGRSIYDISVLTLDTTGPSVMFTATLTGCSVAMRDLGQNRVAVAHVRPNSDMVGVALGGTLDGAGVNTVLSKSGWTSVYGRNSYANNRQTAIVGVRRGGRWKIYAQKQENHGHGAGSIRKVSRIYG